MTASDLAANFPDQSELIAQLDAEGFNASAIMAEILARLEQEAARRVA